jgi:CheY-like chemotaxis protein
MCSPTAVATRTSTQSPASVVGRNILIVEDEKLVLWSLKRALEKAGYAISVAESGEEAIAHLAVQHYDLVITDLGLPSVSGLEVTAAIPRGIPIIVISASQELSALQDDPRIRCCVEKPFDLRDITSAVELFLPLHHANK